MTKTLAALIAAHPDDAQALGAPDRVWLNYSGLRSLAADVAQTLHRAGIGRGDRVAIVLPNGPEMATAFLTVAQVATTAPLNRRLSREADPISRLARSHRVRWLARPR